MSSKKGQAQGTILNPAVKKLTADEREAKTSGLLREYLASGDIDEACGSLKSLKSHYQEAMVYIGTEMLEKKIHERELVGALMVAMCKAKVVKESDAAKAVVELFGLVEDMEMDIPKAGVYVAECAAVLVGSKCVSLADVKDGLQPLASTGKAANLAATMLVIIAESHKEACARELWEASEIDLTQWLPEGERDEEHTFAFATDNKVEWLYPFMGCKQHMHEAFAADQEPEAIIAWLKENVPKELLFSDAGARSIMRTLLRAFSPASEAAKLRKYATIAEHFFNTVESKEMTRFQLQMVYEVQLFCNELDFDPKDLVKRLFHAVYEYDMVSEEAFSAWKDDTGDKTPGKMRALLQANAFIQWLAEAEEEEEDSDDG